MIMFAMDGRNFELWGSGDPVDTQLSAFDHGIKKNTIIISLDPTYLGWHGLVHGAFGVVVFEWLANDPSQSQRRREFVTEYGNVDFLTIGAMEKLPPEWFSKPLDEYLVTNIIYGVQQNPYYGMTVYNEMLLSLVDPKRTDDDYSCEAERQAILLNALDVWYGWREAHDELVSLPRRYCLCVPRF